MRDTLSSVRSSCTIRAAGSTAPLWSINPDSNNGICRHIPNIRRYQTVLADGTWMPVSDSTFYFLPASRISLNLGSCRVSLHLIHDSTTPRPHDRITGARKTAWTRLLPFLLCCIISLAVGVRIVRLSKDWIGRHQNAKTPWTQIASSAIVKTRFELFLLWLR